jgi:hypothetical protein
MYKNVKDKQALSATMKQELFDVWLMEVWAMHVELNAYKAKRKAKKTLLEKRLAAPQTKTMKKKLRGKLQKTPK